MALAVVVAAMLLGVALFSPGIRPIDYAAVVLGSLVLVLVRRAPLVPLAVSTVCMLVFSIGAQPGPSAAFPLMVSVFAATWAGHRLLPALAGVVFFGGTLAANLTTVTDQTDQQIVQGTALLLGWFMAAGVAGVLTRQRRAYLVQVEERAAEAERTREEMALRRAGEERLRIARELHDSLTHSISIIKVQAGVAVHLSRKRGEEVPPALLAIQEASGEAMRELRATLEVLRDSGDEAPPSSLDRLGDLLARARSAGLPVTVTITGERRSLPAEVDQAAYRIVQEALTNITRHAGEASASVSIDYGPGELVVQVDDDGQAGRSEPVTAHVPGVGLLGMRERVTALGGTLRAGARAGGGFTVRAELPVESTSRSGLPVEATS